MRRWIVGALMLALAVGAAVAYTYTAPKRYDAISRVVVHPVPAGDTTYAGVDVLRDAQDESRTMATAAKYFETSDVVAAAADQLGTTADTVRDHLDVRPLTGSNVLQVVGKDDHSRRAAEIANAVRQVGIAQRTARFQAQVAAVLEKLGRLGSVEARRRVVDLRSVQGRPDPTLETLTVATAPEEAAWPEAEVVIPAGAGIGFGLAALIVLLPPLFRGPRAEAVARYEEAERELADREQALERRADAIAQRERELAAAVDDARAATADENRHVRRVAEVTKREQAMARQAAELTERERTLQEREQALAERSTALDEQDRQLTRRGAELDDRGHDLDERAAGQEERERELEAARVAAEEAGSERPGGWTIQELDRAVSQHADAHPERVEEWRYYLHFLREHADVDGRLPATFDSLVEETFGEVVRDASAAD